MEKLPIRGEGEIAGTTSRFNIKLLANDIGYPLGHGARSGGFTSGYGNKTIHSVAGMIEALESSAEFSGVGTAHGDKRAGDCHLGSHRHFPDYRQELFTLCDHPVYVLRRNRDQVRIFNLP